MSGCFHSPHIDHDDHIDQHIRHEPLELISKLVPFSGLILIIIFLILFLIKQQILEDNRRGFINHHVAGCTKLLILFIAAYPFISIAFRYADFKTPMARGEVVTMGDILVVCTQMLCAIVHDLAAIVIAQSSLAICLDKVKEKDATIEYTLILVWGAFDSICELLPHFSVISTVPSPPATKPSPLSSSRAPVTTFLGTLFETAVVMYLVGSLWTRWTLAFKIAIPVLHVAFSATQLHGSRILWSMCMKQRRLLAEVRRRDVENDAFTVGKVDQGKRSSIEIKVEEVASGPVRE